MCICASCFNNTDYGNICENFCNLREDTLIEHDCIALILWFGYKYKTRRYIISDLMLYLVYNKLLIY